MRTTFILQLATCLCCMFFVLAIANGQLGCTNPVACNYDPAATINNGTCCTDCCVVIDVTAGLFPSEVSWDITCNGNVYASGGAPFNGTFCLDDPCCYTLNMYDSFGDGWNGAVFTIDQYSTAGGLGVGLGNDSHTLASGSYASAAINNVCGSGNWGCTNPAACNFDAAAVCDDGSCCLCANACCVGMQLTGGTFPSEVSWTLTDCNSNIVATGGAPHNQFICMQNNCCYTFTMNDSFGDGWNGATATFSNGCNGFQETHTLASGSTGQVTLNVCIGCVPPVNDLEANAIPLPCGSSLNGTTACSYIDQDYGSCRPTTSGGVWYHIVGTGDLVDVNVPQSTALFDPIIHIYTGVSGAMTPIMVNDDESYSSLSAKACFSTVAGVNYYILVSAAWSGQGPCYGGTFVINLNCSSGCTIPVSNDECVIAQVLSPSIPTTGTTVCANADQLVNSLLCTNTVVAPTAAGFCPSAYGVWYFVPSGTSFTITYTMIDAVVEFSGTTCPLCTPGVVNYLPTGSGTYTAPLSGGPSYLLVYSIQCFGGGGFGFPIAPGGPGMPEDELLPGEFIITVTEILPGCTDPLACNYDPLANEDDGTCTFPGCTDPLATNYDPLFGCDDGSCFLLGCTQPSACNYDPNATVDSGICCFQCCTYINVTAGTAPSEITWDIRCDNFVVASGGAPYNGMVCLPLGCCFTLQMYDTAGDDWNGAVMTVDSYANSGGGGIGYGIDEYTMAEGLTSQSVNMNSCYSKWGCTNGFACNFNPLATCDDNSCCYGCCFHIDVTAGTQPSEYPTDVSWQIESTCPGLPTDIIASGGALHNEVLCLPYGCCLKLVMFDSYGDGWNGATITLSDQNGNSFPYSLTNGSYGTQALSYLCESFCVPPPPNDNPYDPIYLAMATFPTCNTFSGDLMYADDSPESAANGPDLWYLVSAISSGISIAVTANNQDINIGLFDAALNPIAFVNDIPEIGDETLNFTGLDVGADYFISVGNCDVDLGVGPFDMCISYLPDSQCDYGPGPYSLCNQFKADYVGADGYFFQFEDQETNSIYGKVKWGTTFLTLSQVPGIQYGATYNVAISAIWIVDGDTVYVPTQNVCEVIINAQPTAVLRPSDNCTSPNPGSHFLGNYVAAQPFVCGAIDWKWEFTRTDVPELPIVHYKGNSNRFLRLLDVSGLVPGGSYSVKMAPVFSYGDGVFGASDCMSIVGPGGMVLDTNNHHATDQSEHRSLSENEVEPLNAILFPNPNSGESFTIAFEEVWNENVSIILFDSFGRMVIDMEIGDVDSSELRIELDQQLSAGLYTVKIHTNNQISTQRMIVQK